MKTFLQLLSLALVCLGSLAEPHKDYPKIDDTSFREGNGDRVIRLSVEVPAAAKDVWQTITTAEGWKSYAVAFASFDMKIGGIIETSYNPEALIGDTNNIKNEIVAYIPGKMLAIRCVQAPQNFEHKKEFFSTATILELTPINEKSTRVTANSVGFKSGEAYDDLFKKFHWGNAYTLEKLRQRFEPKPASPASTK
jgi:hypothetical protein